MSVLPFDDRDGFIWFDGKLVPWRDAKVHVLTHGLHYASCVFEGERVYDGKIFKLTEHSRAAASSRPNSWASRSPTASPRSTRATAAADRRPTSSPTATSGRSPGAAAR